MARYVDLSKSPGSPLLDAATAALRASDHATAKQELAAALKKLDPVADFVPWLVAHMLWGRACKATGDNACAEREYEIVRTTWADPDAAEQRARGDEPDQGVQDHAVGRAVTAVGEALFFFADRHRREKIDPIKMPEYKGNGTQKDVSRYHLSDMMPWMKDKLAALNTAEREYNQVVSMAPGPSARWSIEAAAAAGRMWDVFVQEIMRAPVPLDFKKPGYEKMALDYQQILVVTAFPPQKRARNAFQVCRDFADRSPGHDELAKECVAWLEKNPAPEAPPSPPEWMRSFLPPTFPQAPSGTTR